jgi:adenosylhomocysteine nucleosidase
LASSGKIAIVAALEREVRLIVQYWSASEREYQGRRFKFFENDRAVLVCGGIGAEAARRACEAVIALYHPALVQSVGFAGALDPTLKVGQVFVPRLVIDAGDGSRVEAGHGNGILVSFGSIADPAQKAKLAKAYGAQAIDMEAAAVARAAQARGVAFSALKAVSDEVNFVMPPVHRFIDYDGQFRMPRFAAHIAFRPWLWLKTIHLARNSSRAAAALCAVLDDYNYQPKKPRPELHSGSEVKI